MARSRSKRARRRRRSPAAAPREPKPSEAERQWLQLARRVGAASDLAAAVTVLAEVHAPAAPLPRAIARARIDNRDDKTGALALAWAREQVRLALEELVRRAPARGGWPDAATRAWLLLAAAESIAHEPPAAAADRLRALLDLV
jgi:hypothetical protein